MNCDLLAVKARNAGLMQDLSRTIKQFAGDKTHKSRARVLISKDSYMKYIKILFICL